MQTIAQVQTPSGRPAWRISRYRQIKVLMEDRRLAMNHPDPQAALQWYSDSPMHRILVRLAGQAIPEGERDYEERARRRASVTRMFAPQHVHRTMPDVRAVADELLDDMVRETPPVDLGDRYSVPLCARVVCELLDVPATDIEKFRQWADDREGVDFRRSMIGLKRLMSYTDELVRRRRAQPGDDVVSAMLAAEPEDDDRYHEGRITNLVAWMLGLGWQVAASAIDWGALLLLTHPDQLQLLRADPSLLPSAAEEVLRLFNATSAAIGGLDRYAHADIEFEGVTIRTGDMVLLDVPAANRDSEVFPDPDTFDIRRSPNPHLTFGHGFYFCNFSRVARAEVELGLAALLDRLPRLRLAVPVEQLRYKQHPQAGPVELPITW